MIVVDTKEKLHNFLYSNKYVYSSSSSTGVTPISVMVKGIKVGSHEIYEISKIYSIDSITFIECTIGRDTFSGQLIFDPMSNIKFIRCEFINKEITVRCKPETDYVYFQDCCNIGTLTVSSSNSRLFLQGMEITTVIFKEVQYCDLPLRVIVVDSCICDFCITGKGGLHTYIPITDESLIFIRSKVENLSIKGSYDLEFHNISSGSPTSETLCGDQIDSITLSISILESCLKAFDFSKVYVPCDSVILFQGCDLSGVDLSDMKFGGHSSSYPYMTMYSCSGIDKVILPKSSTIRDVTFPIDNPIGQRDYSVFSQ